MPAASDPAERLVRVHWSVVAALVSGSLSFGAHALAGGGLPTSSHMVLLVAISAGLGWASGAVAGTRGRAAEIVSVGAALTVAQLLGHLAMHTGGHHASTPLLPGPTMIGSHVAALLISAVLLVGARECARRICSRILASTTRPLIAVGDVLVVVGAVNPLRPLFGRTGIRPRGPPALPA
ncbi:hypothetical protein JTZ10_06045 [Gordonia rubripertincta]|uniref:Uncharacterized protein n=1 Tax=Gordonia rubripertincta TaxID=36822 RepID=A0AAW4G260_GORRU|nr:hypothetical protein [Gordonia rubripertincta]MBM7277317.1 hypothetical protein [Gordonia rubripertincta]